MSGLKRAEETTSIREKLRKHLQEGSSEQNLREEERISEQKNPTEIQTSEKQPSKAPKTTDHHTVFQNRTCGTRSDKTQLRTTPKKKRTFSKGRHQSQEKASQKNGQHSVLFSYTQSLKKKPSTTKTLPDPPLMTRRDARP